MPVTTKTADMLTNMAFRLSAMSDAIYETDKDIAAEVMKAARALSNSAAALEKRLEAYAAKAAQE